MMANCFGKRFLFAIIMGVCASVVTVMLKYPPEIYYKIVLTLSGIFTISQTYSNIKDKQNNTPPTP